MAHYEVWKKSELVSGSGNPEQTCYVIDTAIDFCKRLSTGTMMKTVWRPKPGGIPGWWGHVEGTNEEVIAPKAFALVEVDKQSVLRGWGIGGVYMTIKHCKRCADTGDDGDNMCPSCKGCSFNPLE